MDTVVVLPDEIDFGAGTHSRVTIVDTTFAEQENGTLEVYSKDGGKAAAFPRGQWIGVVRGAVVRQNGTTEVRR